MVPRIRNLGPRWRRVIRFTPGRFSQEKVSPVPAGYETLWGPEGSYYSVVKINQSVSILKWAWCNSRALRHCLFSVTIFLG
jgi:hypothetical protein